MKATLKSETQILLHADGSICPSCGRPDTSVVTVALDN